MLSPVGELLPSAQESLLVSGLFLVIVVMGVRFRGSVLLRWAYALRRIPNEFGQGKRSAQESTDDEEGT